jgi:hypothetical protein
MDQEAEGEFIKNASVLCYFFKIIPGKGLIKQYNAEHEHYKIGMYINDCLNMVSKRYKIEISYPDVPMEEGMNDIIIDIKEFEIKLYFDYYKQILKEIQIYGFNNNVKYVYDDNVIDSTNITMLNLYQLFGPTQVGEIVYDDYILNYNKGMKLLFKLDQKEILYIKKRLVHDGNFLPVEIGDDQKSPYCTEIKIFEGKDKEFTNQNITLVDLTTKSISINNGSKCLTIKKSKVQDILAMLSEPDSEHVKKNGDYFYNYFKLGFDILFDAKEHYVKKIVLHSNAIGHIDFSEYHKCNWVMKIPMTENNDSILNINVNNDWNQIQEKINHDFGKPFLNDRGSLENPFGATLLYGLKVGVIFEVVQTSSVISSVTLF